MSANVKPGWRKVKFGDVVRLSKTRCADPLAEGIERYVGLEHLEPGDLRIRSWGNVADGVTFTSVCKPGQVLFGKRRAYQRKVAVTDFACVCSGDIYVLESSDADALLPELLPFICQTDAFFEHAVGTSAGSLSPRTNWSSLADFEFALPPPHDQQRLAQVLTAVVESISAAEDLRIATGQMLDSTLVQLYSRGIYGEPLAHTPIGALPKNWQLAPLGEKYEIQLGKKLYKEFTIGDGQVPYLRNANVQWNRFDLSDVATMSFSETEKHLYQLNHGDILACEGRHVGKSAIWRGEIPGACYQMALHRLRRRSEAQIPEYMLHCLRYYSITGRFRAVTGETTIPHLPAESLKQMLFPFPPSAEQEAIAGTINELCQAVGGIDARIRNHRSVLAGLQRKLLGAKE